MGFIENHKLQFGVLSANYHTETSILTLQLWKLVHGSKLGNVRKEGGVLAPFLPKLQPLDRFNQLCTKSWRLV